MRLILGKLGLQVNEQEQAVPSLSRLHLTAHSLADVSDLVATWSEIITVMDGDEYINIMTSYSKIVLINQNYKTTKQNKKKLPAKIFILLQVFIILTNNGSGI